MQGEGSAAQHSFAAGKSEIKICLGPGVQLHASILHPGPVRGTVPGKKMVLLVNMRRAGRRSLVGSFKQAVAQLSTAP